MGRNTQNKTAPVVVCGLPEERFTRYGVTWPEDWVVRYVNRKYTPDVMADADYLLVDAMDDVNAELMDSAPELKVIHSEGVSYNRIDTEAASERGIYVCNNRAVNKVAVAEHCIALMLAGVKKISMLDNEIRQKGYASANAHFLEVGVSEIAGMTIGMIGMGAIGREVLARLQGWDCNLCYYDPFRMPEEAEKENNLTYMELDDLFRASDVITVHVPVLPSTIGMVGKDQIAEMKKDAVLVNVSRGSIVDQDALVEALENGSIGCAALDTVDPEPMPADHPLLNMSEEAMERVVFTTHSAGRTKDAFRRMLEWSVNDFRLANDGGQPNNIVNLQ